MDGILWDRLGVWVWEIENNNLDTSRVQWIQWMKENDFGWLAIQCFNGSTLVDQNVMKKWKDELEHNNLELVLWGVHGTDPTGDASRASSQINLWKPAAYIANAEAEYKTDSGGTRAHAATFCTAFRTAQPAIKGAFSSFGAASGTNIFGSITDVNAGVMDYKSWYDAGFHWLPQAYFNQDATYQPNLVVRHARRAGWPFHYIHPTIGIYGQPNVLTDTPSLRAVDYRTEVRRLETTDFTGPTGSRDTAYGWNSFHAPSMIQQDYIDMGKYANDDKAARIPKTPASYLDIVQGHRDVILYYRMNSSGAFEDEQMGRANDGSYVGTPLKRQPAIIVGDSSISIANGRDNLPYSVKTSGENYLDIGAPAFLTGLAKWTLEAWVIIDTNPGGSAVIARQNTVGNIQWELGFDADGTGTNDRLMIGFYEFNGGDWFIVRDTVSPPYGVPLHIAATWDGINLALYKQGSLVSSSAPGGGRVPPTGTAGNHYIGHRHDSSQAVNGFPGWISDVAFYGTDVTPAELSRHYNAGINPRTRNTTRSGNTGIS